MKVAAVILAAGRSSRFKDGHKLLVEIDGISIVRRVASTIAQSRIDDIILMTGENTKEVLAAAGPGRWRHIENPNAADGLSSSLSLGVQSLAASVDGILVALADMPGISTELVNTLLATFTQSGGKSIVFPIANDGRRGHPVIWPHTLFPALQKLMGDTGGKSLLANHHELWRPVPCNDDGAFTDIDTRTDLDAFQMRTPK